jgi:arylsulfatase A-like enzyme
MRKRLSWIALVAMIGLAGCFHQESGRTKSDEKSSVAARKRPNIVIILADDMGYSDLGCMGSEIATPNIDRLASEGVLFTQFYNTARCCPTRAALLTGLYSHQADVGHMTGNSVDQLGYHNELSHDAATIAEVMHSAGYATYMAGKWHVTSKDSPNGPKDNWPRQRGFDRYYGTIMGGGSYFDPAILTRDNTVISPFADEEYRPEKFYYTDAIADQSARFIRENREREGKPFFMYCAFSAPHWPLHAPAETIAKYKGKYDGGYEPVRAARFERMKERGIIDSKWALSPATQPFSEVEKKDWEARCMEVYAAQVDRLDQGVGKIVQSLRETGQLDNTLILILSDNGGCAEDMGRFAQKARWEATTTQPMKATDLQLKLNPMYTRDGRPVRNGKGQMPGGEESFIAYGKGWANVSNTPFREYKHWVHEGGISTPLIAHWPKGISRSGAMERQAGHVIDLMPTCVELAGATYPKGITPMQGVSLVKAFGGEKLERERPIFWEHEGNRAVREGKWKLVAKGKEGAWELYDMEVDRTELHDLAGENAEKAAEMAEKWQKWAESSHVLPLVPWEKKKVASR